jgi:hypothetical protein
VESTLVFLATSFPCVTRASASYTERQARPRDVTMPKLAEASPTSPEHTYTGKPVHGRTCMLTLRPETRCWRYISLTLWRCPAWCLARSLRASAERVQALLVEVLRFVANGGKSGEGRIALLVALV